MAADRRGLEYYKKCIAGGAVACGLTHTGIVALDLIKCRRQVNPALYASLVEGLRRVRLEEGARGLVTGWLPTLVGYSLQGGAKYGCYELLKNGYSWTAGERSEENRILGYALSSAVAELLADILLCPWEAVKVRMQTSPRGKFPRKLLPAIRQIQSNEGVLGLYKGIYALWARQIPYTVTKFVCFEKSVELIYKKLLWARPRSSYSRTTQLSVTFGAGYAAGVLCAVVSHPADTLVSKLNCLPHSGSTIKSVARIYSEIGFKGLWRGLGTRIVMVGALTGFQWWTYDSFKTAFGLQTSGGLNEK